MIRQAEVRDYQKGRVVVLSNDVVNHEAYPIVARLHGRMEETLPYLIGTVEQDPIRGAVDVGLLGFANPDALGEPVGMLTGATMARVLDAVRALFAP